MLLTKRSGVNTGTRPNASNQKESVQRIGVVSPGTPLNEPYIQYRLVAPTLNEPYIQYRACIKKKKKLNKHNIARVHVLCKTNNHDTMLRTCFIHNMQGTKQKYILCNEYWSMFYATPKCIFHAIIANAHSMQQIRTFSM